MRTLIALFAALLFVAAEPVPAQTPTQPPSTVKVTIRVSETQITGVPDKTFILLTTDFPPGVSTGRHTHPGDEYGTVVEGSVMTWQEGGDWKTVTTGQSYYVPANVVHETKNAGAEAARTFNA